jgi:mutator protein MutT
MTGETSTGGDEAIDVAAGLIFREGRLLITQRHHESHLGGLWEFPGGKREANETFEECLQRELREELGVTVAVHELLQTVEHSYPEKTVRLQFFRCSITDGEPSAMDCHDLAWITADELESYNFPAADALLLEQIKAAPELWNQQ